MDDKQAEELQPTPVKQHFIHRGSFKDRLLVGLILGGVLFALFIIIKVMLSVSQQDIDIPVRFTQFGGVSPYITGNWYSHYNFVLAAILIVSLNTFIALRIYRHRRWVSITILSTQLFILLFLLIISGSIINTLPVAG